MNEVATILAELDKLPAVQAELARIASRVDDQRRHDLIELRRRLPDQIARAGEVADWFFASVADPDFHRAYRSKWSAMRSAAALHQANWPAVRLGQDVENYRASAQRVRDANREFVRSTRAAVAILSTDKGVG